MAEPVPLIFSCDTEDYETPTSDDAELLWAQMFARHGIRACFCVVGEEARALRDRGRRDVLDALAGHEIASHSNLHSAHPTPAEYLEAQSFTAGVERFRAEEAPAVRDLHDLFGQQPSAWCKPGNSWGPAVPSAAAVLGMPVFCDAPLEWAPGQPMWFAGGPLLDARSGASTGSIGGLLLKYHTSFDRYFQVPAAERPAQMRADFERLLASRLEEAQRTRTGPGYVVMYTHPCRTVTAAFPNNFTAGKNPPRSAWQPAPLRPRAEVDALVRDFDAFLGWIAELRAQGRVALTGYRELYARFQEPSETRLPVHHVMELARALSVDNAPMTPRRVAGQWLSPAEQYGLLAGGLAHATVWNELPKELPLRRLLGPLDDEGVNVQSARVRGPVPLAAVQRAAQAVDKACVHDGAIPMQVELPGVLRGAGPGRALRAIARGLVIWNSGAHHDTTLTLPAGGDETAFAQREDFRRLRYQGTWSIFPPAFTGQRLLAQARRQTWAAKPA